MRGSNCSCNLICSLRRARKRGERFGLKAEDGGGSFLACFDAWLVIGVDVDQRGVEADGALEQGDESTHDSRVHAANRDGHGLAVVAVERFARADQEAAQII